MGRPTIINPRVIFVSRFTKEQRTIHLCPKTGRLLNDPQTELARATFEIPNKHIEALLKHPSSKEEEMSSPRMEIEIKDIEQFEFSDETNGFFEEFDNGPNFFNQFSQDDDFCF